MSRPDWMAKVAHVVPVEAWVNNRSAWTANGGGAWWTVTHSKVLLETERLWLTYVHNGPDIAGTILRVHAAWQVLTGEAVAMRAFPEWKPLDLSDWTKVGTGTNALTASTSALTISGGTHGEWDTPISMTIGPTGGEE